MLFVFVAQLLLAVFVIVFTCVYIESLGGLKWCMVNLFLAHCVQMLIEIAGSIVKTSNQLGFKKTGNDLLALFSKFYYRLAYSILQSLAVFSATSTFQFPMFHSRWFTPFRWWIYLSSCHLLTILIVIGGYALSQRLRIQIQVLPLNFVALIVLIVILLNALVALYRYRGKTGGYGMSRQLVLSILIYTVIPTVWLIPSAGVSVTMSINEIITTMQALPAPGLSSGSLLNSENGGMPGNGSAMPGGGGMPNGGGPGNHLSGSSLNNTIEKSVSIFDTWQNIFSYTVVFAHSLSTMIALGVYRRALANTMAIRWIRKVLPCKIAQAYDNTVIVLKSQNENLSVSRL